MNYSVETAYGKVIVKTEEDIESDRCRLMSGNSICLLLPKMENEWK